MNTLNKNDTRPELCGIPFNSVKTLIHHQHQTQYWKHITNLAVQWDSFPHLGYYGCRF